MAKMTPPLHTTGRYTLKHPWTTDATTLYTCMAIRTFQEIRDRGLDPYTEFYKPMGLSQEAFKADEAEGANIVTLMSETQPAIRVPDTYILHYPNLNNVTYNHVVVSLSMGALPDFLSLEFLKDQLANVASDVIGIRPEVALHVAASSGGVTPEEHERLEVARLQSVKLRDTDYAQKLALQRENARLVEQIKTLEQIVIENGLLD